MILTAVVSPRYRVRVCLSAKRSRSRSTPRSSLAHATRSATPTLPTTSWLSGLSMPTGWGGCWTRFSLCDVGPTPCRFCEPITRKAHDHVRRGGSQVDLASRVALPALNSQPPLVHLRPLGRTAGDAATLGLALMSRIEQSRRRDQNPFRGR
jgi:hypothetical protein